ncbi:hypothetical protein ACET3Z_013111 [Daucus carota]
MRNVTEMKVDPGSRQEIVSTPMLNVELSRPLLPSNLEEMPPGEHAQSLSSTSTTEKFGSSILEQSLTTGCPRQVPACFREGNAYLRALQGIEYRVIWEESMDERPWEKARSMYNDELEAGYKSVSLLDGIVG